MIKKKILKQQKGIVLSDAIVAILIILLFVGITTSIMVNITLESTKIKMNSQQIDFATEIFEYAEGLSYDSVTEQSLIGYVNDKRISAVSAAKTEEIDSLTTPYKIGIKVEKYNATAGNTDKLDIIKTITLTIKSDINSKSYTTTMSTIKKATMDEVLSKL